MKTKEELARDILMVHKNVVHRHGDGNLTYMEILAEKLAQLVLEDEKQIKETRLKFDPDLFDD